MTHGIPTTDAPPPLPRPITTGDMYGRPPRKHTMYIQLSLEATTTNVNEVESSLSKILSYIRDLGVKVKETHTRDFD